MEVLIVICLLIVIALLLHDKIATKKRQKQKPVQKKVSPNLPDIMGQPKPIRSLSVPNSDTKNQIQHPEIDPDHLDIEYDENENIRIQIPQEELDEVFTSKADWQEEEEEWNSYGIASGDNGFAQGVTFEELSSVGILLQKDKLEPSQKETAVSVVQKIRGTELFSLLENSMESASRKIAELLDSTLSSESDHGSSDVRKNDLRQFDIEEFI